MSEQETIKNFPVKQELLRVIPEFSDSLLEAGLYQGHGSEDRAGAAIGIYRLRVLKYFHSVATPALLFNKEPAQGTQSPLLGAFLAFHWFFMAQKDSWHPCRERLYYRGPPSRLPEQPGYIPPAEAPALGELAGSLQVGGGGGFTPRLYPHVVGRAPLYQPLLPVRAVDHGLTVLLLLTALSQVDEGEDQGEEDDDEGPQEQRHHHSLCVRLLTHPGTGGTGGAGSLRLLALHTLTGVQSGVGSQGGGGGHHGHTGLSYEETALASQSLAQQSGLQDK